MQIWDIGHLKKFGFWILEIGYCRFRLGYLDIGDYTAIFGDLAIGDLDIWIYDIRYLKSGYWRFEVDILDIGDLDFGDWISADGFTPVTVDTDPFHFTKPSLTIQTPDPPQRSGIQNGTGMCHTWSGRHFYFG